jgi:uncharacterized lipoprotein
MRPIRSEWGIRVGLAALLASLAASGCAGKDELICKPATDYLEADSIGQLRIPNDLTVPDESESLRIPAVPPTAASAEAGSDPCLEASPAYRQTE